MERILIAVAVVFGILLIAQFFISRKSQKVMESMLLLLTKPERAKIQDAARVIQTMMAGEIDRIESIFKSIYQTLSAQISRAEEMQKNLGERNATLVSTADEAAKKIAIMSQRLDNTLDGFQKITGSREWSEIEKSTTRFSNRINELLNQIDDVSQNSIDKAKLLQQQIDGWIESGKSLAEALQSAAENNASQMNSMVIESSAVQEKMRDVAEGFVAVKTAAADYESAMTANDKLLANQLQKMDAFTKQSKTLLANQVNTLTDTANSVGGQIRLAESSIEKQTKLLHESAENIMESAQATEISIKNISNELIILNGKFQSEIKEFATEVVGELNQVHGVANTTLSDTKAAAAAFSESVRAMATGVRETLIEMNNAHGALTAQSEGLIKMSAETTAQLQPLARLIEGYQSALPQISGDSAEITKKIKTLKDAAETALAGIADSNAKLERLSGESRQQMIDLMSDYAKAVDTMQTLNRQMMEARASAPMAAIAEAPARTAKVDGAAFMRQAEKIMERLHELSVDLTRAVGADIPDAIWKKYHDGDKAIFSKWFAKMLGAADKKRVREIWRSDAVFRSQATQFVRSFGKIMAGAEQTDNREVMTAAFLKTDLGRMYLALKIFV